MKLLALLFKGETSSPDLVKLFGGVYQHNRTKKILLDSHSFCASSLNESP